MSSASRPPSVVGKPAVADSPSASARNARPPSSSSSSAITTPPPASALKKSPMPPSPSGVTSASRPVSSLSSATKSVTQRTPPPTLSARPTTGSSLSSAAASAGTPRARASTASAARTDQESSGGASSSSTGGADVAPAATVAASQAHALRVLLMGETTSTLTPADAAGVIAPDAKFSLLPRLPAHAQLRAAVGVDGARPALFDTHAEARELLSNAELLRLLCALHASLDRASLARAVEGACRVAGLLGPELPTATKHVQMDLQFPLSPSSAAASSGAAKPSTGEGDKSPRGALTPRRVRPSTSSGPPRLYYIVVVKTLGGQLLSIECTPDDTALSLKHKVAAHEPLYQVGRQKLYQVIGGEKRPLENDKLLSAQGVVDGTEVMLSVVAVAPGTLRSSFGVRGKAGAGHFTQPRGIATAVVAGKTRLFVSDADNHRVICMKSNETHDKVWQYGATGQAGRSDGKLNNPIGLAISTCGECLYIADSFNHRIVVLNANDGAFVSAFGAKGLGIAQFQFPFGVAAAADRTLWVADSSNHRCLCFDTTCDPWRPMRQVGLTNEDGSSAAHLSRPWGVALFGDRLFVADMDNSRIQVFDSSTGAFVRTIAQHGDGDGQLDKPSGVCVGGDNLYVAELGNHRVSVFSCVEFTFRGSFGRKGDAAGCFQAPIGLAVDTLSREICVTDFDRHRISMFSAYH